jgi:hypothetical protein
LTSVENEAIGRAQRVKDYLVKMRQIDPDRIVIRHAGYRRRLAIELYLVPPGAIPLFPHPNNSEPQQLLESSPSEETFLQRLTHRLTHRTAHATLRVHLLLPS